MMTKQRGNSNHSIILWKCVFVIGFILIIGSFLYTLWVSWDKFLEGNMVANLLQIFSEMIPPNLSVIMTLGEPILETTAMSVMATLLSILISFPLSFLAASNVTSNAVIRGIIRALFGVLRTIPELIMGVIFVAAVGFGILPGILALGFHSIGMLGKFYAEAIEKVDEGLNEAVVASGGSTFHMIIFSVIPQIISHVVDYSLYRWEYNFRASTVVGLIGAGGLGFHLIASLRIMQYRDVFAILLVIFILVQMVDKLGSLIRSQLIGGNGNER